MPIRYKLLRKRRCAGTALEQTDSDDPLLCCILPQETAEQDRWDAQHLLQ